MSLSVQVSHTHVEFSSNLQQASLSEIASRRNPCTSLEWDKDSIRYLTSYPCLWHKQQPAPWATTPRNGTKNLDFQAATNFSHAFKYAMVFNTSLLKTPRISYAAGLDKLAQNEVQSNTPNRLPTITWNWHIDRTSPITATLPQGSWHMQVLINYNTNPSAVFFLSQKKNLRLSPMVQSWREKQSTQSRMYHVCLERAGENISKAFVSYCI